MSWVRINDTLPWSPKVVRLAGVLGWDCYAALGAMVRWLCWLDAHCVEGCTGCDAAGLNELVFGEDGEVNGDDVVGGLVKVGWAEVRDGVVWAADWGVYNGEVAKVRAQGQARQQRRRRRLKAEG